MFKWRKGRKDFSDALHLAWLVIAVWSATSAIGLFALKNAGVLKQATAISLCVWPIAIFWRVQSIHRRYSRSNEGILRIYSLLMQAMVPCSLLWFILLYWTL
ncbi:MAG: hypothetical protein ABI972_20320 [Acidobacteriota bacterium]